MKQTIFYIFALCSINLFAQNKIIVDADFDVENKEICIKQTIQYFNTSSDTLSTIYLTDWNNSFSSKHTPLAQRFAEEFNNSFHFADFDDRGFTMVTNIVDSNNNGLTYKRNKEQPDILEVKLAKPLTPNSSYTINLDYTLVVPNSRFTRYGVTDNNSFMLKYWYLTPAIYDGKWNLFSNKNIDDSFIPKSDIKITVEYPSSYYVTSELNEVSTTISEDFTVTTFKGEDRIDSKFFLTPSPVFSHTETDNFTVVSDIKEKGINNIEQALIIDKIVQFVSNHLPSYPHEKLLVTEIDVKKDPIFGLNQLPDFIRPFPKTLHYELKLVKNTIGNYLDNVFLINPRKEQWIKDAIQNYYLMKYIDEHYPDMKLLGKLADVWGIRSFHAADLKFNEQYNFFYMNMARNNRDQSLSTPNDSLLRYNNYLANKAKAGIGLKYLENYLEIDSIDTLINKYLETNLLENTSADEFENYLKQNSSKNIDWFFDDYVNTRGKIDFKLKHIKTDKDSVSLVIKNKRDNKMPVSLFEIKNDSVINKVWIDSVEGEKTITLANKDADKYVLNYDKSIPEYNLRDNYKSKKNKLFGGKPLQIRLFKDIEDPQYNQIFFMPVVQFKNIYDGITIGASTYNTTILRRPFSFKFTPQYATKSSTLTGRLSLSYQQNFENRDLFNVTYGIASSYNSYAEDLFVTRISPYVIFNFREDDNFRSNLRKSLSVRYLDISRGEPGPDSDIINTEPNYSVINARYLSTNPGIIDFEKWFADIQFSKNFGKLSFNYEFRRLFENNRQLNVRFFAGTFLYNNNDPTDDYFSFALDRPTDYFFDYNYLGRSENSGIFSQQLVMAEGGFKSMLEPHFANQWMVTSNVSTSIWKYIHAYGDAGFVKNKFNDAKFVYGTGVRFILVEDYFELYFPVYSNLGWEVAEQNYIERIRFQFTIDPKTLLGLFRRKWY